MWEIIGVNVGGEPVSERLTSNRNKSYSEIEEEFLRSCAKLALERNITNADVARCISPLLDRTIKGIELKMGFVKQEVLGIEKQRKQMYKEEMEELHQFIESESKKESTSFGESTIQTFQEEREPLHQALVQLDMNDIGKRLKVRVYNVMPYGAFCETEDGKTGLILKGFVSTDFVERIEDYLQVGDVFEAMVVEDKKQPGRVLLNAKILGNIIPLAQRR